MEADEKSVVKCIVISPKGKQKSLISVQHPCSIVNNRFFIPERPKRIMQESAVNYTFKKAWRIFHCQASWIILTPVYRISVTLNTFQYIQSKYYYAIKHNIIFDLIFALLSNISWSCLWKPWHIHLIIIVAKNNILKK